MSIRVELFGVPRQRAGIAETHLRLVPDQATLGDALRELVERYPRLGSECVAPDGRVKAGYTVSLDGERFVQDPQTPLAGVKTLLLLSADAGG